MELLEIAGYEDKWKKKEELEPTSVLHMRSPSDSTSVSTLSSSFAGGDNTAGVAYLQPIPSGAGVGFEDWESLISGSAASSLAPEQSLLRWISGDVDHTSFGLKQLLQSGFEQFGVSGTISAAGDPNSHFPGSGFSPDGKHQLLTGHQQSQNHQNPNFFMPLPFTGHQEQHHHHKPQPKRRHNTAAPEPPISDPGHECFLGKLHHQNQHLGFPPAGEETAQALVDQLYQAAELVGAGNFSHAQVILARLNHQLSPAGNPLHRATLYFKEALQHLLLPVAPPPRTQAPVDFIFKLGAYKLFSELSPMTHFINFTCNQALLEALNNSDRIHIFDFELGSGAQWASFMEELPVASSLKVTAFASPSTHHPLELELIRENLTQFAIEIGLNFELELINFDSFNQSSYPLPNDAVPVAVNFPLRSISDRPYTLPSILHFIKTLSPKIMVSSDRGGCDRSDLPFPQHLLQALQTHVHLFESLDAVNAAQANVDKIERFLLHPMIERTVLGRLGSPEKVPFWRTLFASAGFSPVPFSDFTGAQAECVVRRAPVRGFHVEKRQESLSLCWQGRELVSASAWRC